MQADTYAKYTIYRTALLQFFSMFGGFLSLVRVLTNFSLKDMQTFSAENSMIKKLFTTINEKEDDNDVDFCEEGEVNAKENLKKNLLDRSIFSYKYLEHWKFDTFSSKLCCCCRSSPTKNEKLF